MTDEPLAALAAEVLRAGELDTAVEIQALATRVALDGEPNEALAVVDDATSHALAAVVGRRELAAWSRATLELVRAGDADGVATLF
jgi:hypothetical protein